jgi:hypothetical protein
LVESISEALGIHPSAVEVEYDPTTGVATYTITSEDAETLSDVISAIEAEDFEDDVNANLVDEIDGMSISDVVPPTEIEAEIKVIVDATDLENPEDVVDTIETDLKELDEELEIESEVKFITSAPTMVPSEVPSVSPTTMIPTAAPSYHGMVATIVATSVATEELTTTEIQELTEQVAEIYGVEETDVQTEVQYEVSGTIDVEFPEDVTDEEKIEALTEALSTSLNVHPKDIEIEIDEETGEITYTITSDDLSGAQAVQWALTSEETQKDIETAIEELIPEATVEEIQVEDEIMVEVEFSVNADEAEAHLVQAADQVANALENAGFTDVSATSEYVTMAPSFVPSTTPTTSIPTVAPSITGAVAIISTTKSVTEELTPENITSIVDSVATTYGVDEEDVEIVIEYTSTGTIDIEIPESIIANNLTEFLESFEEQLAEELGIHIKDIEVTYNETSGEIEYTLVSSNFTEIEELQELIGTEDFVE